MPNPKYQTRLPADQAERVDEYAEERNISNAEAVRRLIVSGLGEQEQEEEAEGEAAPESGPGKLTLRWGDRGAFIGALGLILTGLAMLVNSPTFVTFGVILVLSGGIMCFAALGSALFTGQVTTAQAAEFVRSIR